jgi:hypothetical protein
VRIPAYRYLLLLLPCFLCANLTTNLCAQVDFDEQVAPILVAHCLDCHSGAQPEGGLSLLDRKLAVQGGDSGPALNQDDALQSLLWERIAADEMPPKKTLSTDDKATLQQWLSTGAQWTNSIDRFARTSETRGGRDWWSLLPLAAPALTDLSGEKQAEHKTSGHNTWGHNAIDAFVYKRLHEANLTPTTDAAPRTLIRRLYFDLIGLPPTPEEVARFETDPSNQAYEKIVDDLLASEHYGERWARHWLDVVRYGESDGFERNAPRENSWRYRDWVIEALNADLPYDQFVRMQLIGDQLVGGTQGAAATGFWVAGVHNTVVGGSKRMQELARQDELEEVLAVVGQTFVGLTINCARCHDHKFDPITQEEYYQFASAISGLGYGERVEQTAEDQARLRQLEEEFTNVQSQLASMEQAVKRQILEARQEGTSPPPIPPTAVARWEFDNDLHDSLGNLHGTAHGTARIEASALVLDGNSYVETPALDQAVAEKTLEVLVQLNDLKQSGGAAISIEQPDGSIFDAIVFAEREPGHWMAGSNGFARSDSFAGIAETEADDRPVHIAMVFQADGTITAYRDGLPYGKPINKAPLQPYAAKNSQLLFGLRHKPEGGNRFLKAKIHRAAVYNRALSADEVAVAANAANFVSEDELQLALNGSQQLARAELKSRLRALGNTKTQTLAEANRVYFTLTPRAGTKTQILLRGDPDNADKVVAPAATAAVASITADFGLTVDSPENQRRRGLADWITHRDNPLFSRVMVNRIWHYHFGTGLVETPSDFGFNGGRPSHPELLDYLALQFRDGGYHLKPLHRLIVTSSTYRQSSTSFSDAERSKSELVDRDNRMLWRGSARRLDGESLRDAMLFVAGKLNPQVGGASFKDVSVVENNGTTYYEPRDVDEDQYWRRTLYRFSPRGGRSALLDTFDCPDPASSAPRRVVTTTPLQALSLMNNAFVLRMSEAFAERVQTETNDAASQVSRAWQLAVARDPTTAEQELSIQLVQQHGLAALCRGLFNSNEFVRID